MDWVNGTPGSASLSLSLSLSGFLRRRRSWRWIRAHPRAASVFCHRASLRCWPLRLHPSADPLNVASSALSPPRPRLGQVWTADDGAHGLVQRRRSGKDAQRAHHQHPRQAEEGAHRSGATCCRPWRAKRCSAVHPRPLFFSFFLSRNDLPTAPPHHHLGQALARTKRRTTTGSRRRTPSPPCWPTSTRPWPVRAAPPRRTTLLRGSGHHTCTHACFPLPRPAKNVAEDGPSSSTVAAAAAAAAKPFVSRRSRMLYSRFKRSKDLSAYSQNDLNCILGEAAVRPESSKHYVPEPVVEHEVRGRVLGGGQRLQRSAFIPWRVATLR